MLEFRVDKFYLLNEYLIWPELYEPYSDIGISLDTEYIILRIQMATTETWQEASMECPLRL